MGQPLLAAAAAAPVTSLTAAALVCVHAAIAHRGAGYEDVGCSYALIAERRLWHRAVLAAVSHVSTLHLVMNCAALWAVRDLERALGSSAYARASLLLVLGVAGVSHATYCVLIRKLGREEYSRHVVVGYSGVVFGLMALAAARAPFGATISLGGLHAPAVLSPFVSLVITHMLIPNASFVGHASGIIVGVCACSVLCICAPASRDNGGAFLTSLTGVHVPRPRPCRLHARHGAA